MMPGLGRTFTSRITRRRELDDESLQNRTRMWLETVLNEELDERVSLSKLLADGHILLKVSTTIQGLMQKHSPGRRSAVSLKNSSPHSCIINFIEVCKKLKVDTDDILFAPDVIEEKDIRKACLCLRALSKKALYLGVLDFDLVDESFSPTANGTSGSEDSENEVPDADNVNGAQIIFTLPSTGTLTSEINENETSETEVPNDNNIDGTEKPFTPRTESNENGISENELAVGKNTDCCTPTAESNETRHSENQEKFSPTSNGSRTPKSNENGKCQNEVAGGDGTQRTSFSPVTETASVESNETEDSENMFLCPVACSSTGDSCSNTRDITSVTEFTSIGNDADNETNLSNEEPCKYERKEARPVITWVSIAIASVALMGTAFIIRKRDPSACVRLNVIINQKK